MIRALVISLFCALSGCNQQGDVAKQLQYNKVSIHYRDFGASAPIRYSRSDLLRFAPVKLLITERQSIQQLVDVLPRQCVEVQEPTEASLDHYLVIRFSRDDRFVDEFVASSLHYVADDGTSKQVCKLDASVRDKIAAWIEKQLA